MNQETVMTVLGDYSPVLKNIVLSAWQDWLATPNRGIYKYPRTRANIVFEYMIKHARQAFRDDKNVRELERNETSKFVMKGKVVFRFKKGNEQGISSNVPTFSALAYNDPQQTLISLPTIQRVDIVYVLNRFETLIDYVSIVARSAGDIAWSYDIYDRSVDGEVVPMPSTPAATAKTSEDVIKVIPRVGKKRTSGNE